MKRSFVILFLAGLLLTGMACRAVEQAVGLPAATDPPAAQPTRPATRPAEPTSTGPVTPLASPTGPAAPGETPLPGTSAPGLAPTAAPAVMDNPPGAAGERSIGDPYAPELGNTGYDVQHYTLRFAIDPSIQHIAGRATIEAHSSLENLGQVSLDFAGYDIHALTVDGQPADFARQDKKLVINLPTPRDPGEAFEIDITYSGPPTRFRSPYVSFLDSLGFAFQSEYNEVFAMSEPDGARLWYPCNDHPRDKATFTIEVTVPEGMTGVSNGVLIDSQTEVPNAFADGRAGDRFTWQMDQPMATYLATVVIGEYELIEDQTPGGVRLRSYVYPEEVDSFERSYPLIADATDWMAEHFGPYPFDEFGYVMVGDTNFSMETQSMVMESSTMGEETLVHELVHQWFGNHVSLDSWADIWRNEGFATYLTALYFTQGDPGQLERVAGSWRSAMRQHAPEYRLDQPPPAQMFNLASYYEGALLVYELHQTIGDEAFFGGLRAYFDQYGGGVASLEEFQAVMEDAAGQPLGPLLEKWFEPGLAAP